MAVPPPIRLRLRAEPIGAVPQAPIAGTSARIRIDVTDELAKPVDAPDLRLRAIRPGATRAVRHVPVREAAGRYYVDLALDTAGPWRLQADCLQPRQARGDLTLTVRAGAVAPGSPPPDVLLVGDDDDILSFEGGAPWDARRVSELPPAPSVDGRKLHVVGPNGDEVAEWSQLEGSAKEAARLEAEAAKRSSDAAANDARVTSEDRQASAAARTGAENSAAAAAGYAQAVQREASSRSHQDLAGTRQLYRDAVPGLLFALLDRIGRAVGWTEGGSLVAAGLELLTAAAYRDAGDVQWGLRDRDGRTPFWLDQDGYLVLDLAQASIAAGTTPYRDAADVITTIVANRAGAVRIGLDAQERLVAELAPDVVEQLRAQIGDGKAALARANTAAEQAATALGAAQAVSKTAPGAAVYRDYVEMQHPIIVPLGDLHGLLGFDAEGGLVARPGRELIEDIGAGLYLPPAMLRGGLSGFNLRRDPARRIVATVQDARGRVMDVRQRSDRATSTTAVVDHRDPLDLITVGGQSFAGGSNSFASALTAPLFRHDVLTTNVFQARGENPAVAASAHIDLQPLANPAGIETFLTTTMGIALEMLDRDAGRPSPGRSYFAAWWGGQPITSINKGSSAYNSLIGAATAFPGLAAAYGRKGRVAAHWFYHGQNNLQSGPYTPYLQQYFDDMRADQAAAAGQSDLPHFFLTQVSGGDTSSAGAVAAHTIHLEQLAWARAKEGLGATLIGPDYWVQSTDGVHPDEMGKQMLGEVAALVMRQVLVEGLTFAPLRQKSLTRSGREVLLTTTVPGLDVTWDTDWIKPAPNYGLSYAGADSGSVSISNVAIVARDKVLVTLSAEPTAGDRRLVAGGWQDSTSDAWSSTRCQLISPTTVESPFWRLGYTRGRDGQARPRYIRHHCVRFEEPIP